MKSAIVAFMLASISTGAFARQAPRDAAAPVSAPTGTAAITGRVVDSVSDEGVRRALVVIVAPGRGDIQTLTDDLGRFSFLDLPAGRYTLTAAKPGYVKTFYGSQTAWRGPALPIAVATGEVATNVTVSLMRGAVLTGTVSDGNGNPISSAQVSPLRVTVMGGERKLAVPPGYSMRATTDDRGVYRLYGLPPGTYALQAGAPLPGGGPGGVREVTAEDIEAATRELQGGSVANRAPASAPAVRDVPLISRASAYFPDAASAADARVVTLEQGQVQEGVDIRLRIVHAWRIEGTMTGPFGPVTNALVGIADLSTGSIWASPGLVRPDATGHFTVPPLTPRRYLFYGRGDEGAADNPLNLWTATEVVVDEGGATAVTMLFAPGVSVGGRIVTIDGAPLPSALTNARVVLTPAPVIEGAVAGAPAGATTTNGRFALSHVTPEKYRLALTGLTGWSLQSVTSGGRETLDSTLDIQPGGDLSDIVVTITNRPTTIAGTLFDQLGKPAPEYALVAFSTERALWSSPRRMSGVVKVGSDGRFSIVGLPAGEYYVATIVDVDPALLRDASLLEELAAAAITVTLAEGELKIQDIKLASR